MLRAVEALLWDLKCLKDLRNLRETRETWRTWDWDRATFALRLDTGKWESAHFQRHSVSVYTRDKPANIVSRTIAKDFRVRVWTRERNWDWTLSFCLRRTNWFLLRGNRSSLYSDEKGKWGALLTELNYLRANFLCANYLRADYLRAD